MSDMLINYSQLFDEYWTNSGRYKVAKNNKRTYNNLRKALSNFKEVGEIDEYVYNLRTRKESTRRIIVDFLRFVENKTGSRLESSLFGKKFYDSSVERQLEIAKYLHTPKTAHDIEEKFDITCETRKKDLQALRKGIEVLGSRIALDEQRIGRKVYYKSTVHPVFLPLNLTEIYALVKYLPEQLKNKDSDLQEDREPNPQDDTDPNLQMIEDILMRIKAQLSDYAWDKIFPDEQRAKYLNQYISDQRLASSRIGVQMYLMKTQKECSFFWNGEEYRGRIRANKIKLNDGSYLDAELNEVDFIIDSFEYE